MIIGQITPLFWGRGRAATGCPWWAKLRKSRDMEGIFLPLGVDIDHQGWRLAGRFGAACPAAFDPDQRGVAQIC